jgi:hypothetical protein
MLLMSVANGESARRLDERVKLALSCRDHTARWAWQCGALQAGGNLLDTDQAGRTDAFSPAEQLLAALSARQATT